jgi:hypothetical protein
VRGAVAERPAVEDADAQATDPRAPCDGEADDAAADDDDVVLLGGLGNGVSSRFAGMTRISS